jgi:hypothetical protein
MAMMNSYGRKRKKEKYQFVTKLAFHETRADIETNNALQLDFSPLL